MSAHLIIAVPSKGRLQENANAFFERAGLTIEQSGGARDYRGAIKGLAGVEIAFLSASEITKELASGGVHMGITGLDLVHEHIDRPEARVEMLLPLGFGHADVVVAVPKGWIDVASMADLADVAADFRVRHRRWIRVATKYLTLTRQHFLKHGIADYRIVESAGATEGAPAAGAAELIVDITTTGSTLIANNLKLIGDGTILKSQAHLVAGLAADWTAETRGAARAVLDRLAAQARARRVRELRGFVGDAGAVAAQASEAFGATTPHGKTTDWPTGWPLTLHCPVGHVAACADLMRAHGAASVTVATLDYVLDATNDLVDRLDARLEGRST